MEDIALSRNYRALWADARKKNTFKALEVVFNDLANELGLPDEEATQANETASAESALRRNSQEKSGIKRQP